MASTSNIPSSSCSEYQWEVFLNFRGTDTRNNFADHLYTALDGKGINTFRDDEGLDRGKPILELLKEIKKSRIAIVILSANYASSTWCLEELEEIVGCMDAGTMTVYPIFYHVEPRDVRDQQGTFAAAFAKHDDERSQEKVQRWRVALRRVAGLSGDPLKNEYESKFIKEIVEKISHELNDKTSFSVTYKNDIVGIDSRVQEIMDLYIDVASDDVRFIGICGMSGIGKTTLAHAVFERIRSQFRASSFLSDVKRRDLDDLQDQLLREMKLKSEIRRWDVLKGLNVTSHRLRKKKVLIVLDDADGEKLEKLAGNHDWFGPGSRIIITTEDKRLLLKNCGKKNVYKAKKLNASDALQLFCREAFGKPHCERDLLDICNGFVRYVDGHPLALKIMGSSMPDITNIGLWKAELERLRESAELPKDKRIQTALRISYAGLSTPTKKLFLDVACLLNGEDKDRIADLLEDEGSAGCIPEINIKDLIDKSLITIVGGKLWMHNLLQQMSWEIVNQECPKRPEKRSRLWDFEDVLEVLNNNKGTDSVEGILLKPPPHKKVRLNADAFSKVKKLRLLKIYNVELPQGLSYLPNELRLMEWHEYPLNSMPRSFQPDKLVELIMPHSHIKRLPKGFDNLEKLKVIDLSDSQNLIKTPSFTGLPNLKKLIFQGCTRLYEIHPSTGTLKKLVLLNLKDCKCLDGLPREINLESLETFILSGCSRLKKFPEIGRNMTRLSELYLDGTAIEELPLSIKHLTGLTLLNLQDCNDVSSFPSVICSLTSLQTLILSGCKGQPHKSWNPLSLSSILSAIGAVAPKPNFLLLKSLSGLGSLVSLDLSDCNLEDGALPDDLSCLFSLQYLNLSKNHFTCLPDSISQLSKLKFLYLDKCSRLKSLANIPLSTQSVMARECTSLENYSNQVIVWTSGETGFTFINCLNSADDEECKVSEVSLLDVHFQPLWQRYMEDQIHQMEGLHSVFPQTEIPEWFSHQNRGSSVPILLPDNLDGNSSWRGIALCIVFEVKNVSPGQDSKYFHEFVCHLDNDGGLLDSPLVINVPKAKFDAGSFGLWLYVSDERFRDRLDDRSCISPSITISGSDVQIQKCGARFLYEEDMVEFVQNLSQEIVGSPEDLRRRQEKIEYLMNPSPSHVEEAESSQSSGQSDSNPRLKRQLKSLLSLLSYSPDITVGLCLNLVVDGILGIKTGSIFCEDLFEEKNDGKGKKLQDCFRMRVMWRSV